MKKILIVGAGGFGKEVAWLIERINQKKKLYEIVGFVDDNKQIGEKIGNYPVVCKIKDLNQFEGYCITIAVGNAKVRKTIYENITKIDNFEFPNLVDPSAVVDEKKLGIGNIICAGNICTVDYVIEDFNIINLSCTIGHDVIIKSFVTIYPGVNVSGNTTIYDCVEVGTGSSIIQGTTINSNAIIGASAAVIRDIESDTVNVGVPAKKK